MPQAKGLKPLVIGTWSFTGHWSLVIGHYHSRLPMIISVPKEIKEQEFRVALPPSAAYQLIKRGHRVLVERDAGVGAGFPDADYEAAGATLVKEHAAVFAQGELIVKVKEPQPEECILLRSGQILFTYLHL